jgi:hypothetical protein
MTVALRRHATHREFPVARDEDEHPLRPHLEATELQLQEALEEVCADEADVEGTNTDELIRIEETLAIASDAAKRAISIRKRIVADRERDDPPPAPPLA